ncbi:efflux RND transporter periplasmic adaptor subunit [Hyphomicrobium sp. CS1GBMeth3]|uniref:efflux RND transporter periplasmic adaptor subunit n=1 Tax=Hyphomicrobium sp. CS1GBMeth3 TaxID=1892845 RepID=UPI00093183D7|nr:efflux RND transporter periplasmic adaptor subunit [Hyphomicrobium sp. CS1GBMeth3]
MHSMLHPFRRSGLAGSALTLAAAASLTLASTSTEAQRTRRGPATEPIVSVYEVKTEPVRERVAAVGSGRALAQVTLTTRVAGVISEVLFKGGDRVEKDQVLVRLASEPEAIAVETAEAQRAQAFDQVERYKQLNEASVSRVVRAEAETALKVADAALRRAREELDRMTIKAPFAGIVGLTNLQTGDYLAVGNPIATLDDRSTIVIEFTVPEAVAPQITTGMPVRASLAARPGEIYNGKVAGVGTRIDPITRTLSVRGEIPNPDLKLIPGSTFSVTVQLSGDKSPVVPGLAIQWDRSGAYVWRLTADDTVERVDAAILARDGDRVFIEAKLAPGDRVVHEGGGLLTVGQKVKILGS